MNEQPTDLTGRVAIVTGGGGGIGYGIGMALARAGADIVIADIEPVRAAQAAGDVRGLGRDALPVPTDVMDTDQVRAMVDAAHGYFGRLDILVNNAGGVSARPFLEQSERSWRRHMDINLVSMFAATAAAVPLMIAGERGGAIINVTSIEGFRAAPYFAVYGACKAAMVSFTKTMALELSEHGIRVNAIAPDHTVTPGAMGNRQGPVDETQWRTRPAGEAEAMNRVIPLGSEGTIEQCGNAALFLASSMSEYVTGATLHVDGGTWAASGWLRDEDGNWTLNQGLRFAPR
ncbi:MAG: SDR family NAD(P)-dependent oxidoreductase [Pseudomonadota bacterium]